MAGITTKNRFLRYLSEEVEASNEEIRSSLNIANDKFIKLKKELLNEGLIEVFARRGGGLRLTKKGEKDNNQEASTPKKVVAKESDLYKPFLESLTKEIDETTPEVAWDISSRKRIGKWMNPDLVKISVEKFEYLKLPPRVFITTYEVKKYKDGKDIKSAFEAAAHKRFSHASYLVIEITEDGYDDQPNFDEISAECVRLGIGLITLKRNSTAENYEHFIKIKAEEHSPLDGIIEQFLRENIQGNKERIREYQQLFLSV